MGVDLRRILLLLAAVPTVAFAGGTATLQTGAEGGRHSVMMNIAWQNEQTFRMQAEGQPAYFIVRDGKAYSVSMHNGQPMVMDMGAMMSMMRGQGGGPAGANRPTIPEPGSFEATGKTETVAGVKGRVYRVQWTDEDGRRRTQDVVLTDDPVVVEMTRAYFGAIGSMFGGDDPQRFADAMPGDDTGMLRAGDDFRVTAISGENPPDSRFELPAPPMDLQQMMGGGR